MGAGPRQGEVSCAACSPPPARALPSRDSAEPACPLPAHAHLPSPAPLLGTLTWREGCPAGGGAWQGPYWPKGRTGAALLVPLLPISGSRWCRQDLRPLSPSPRLRPSPQGPHSTPNLPLQAVVPFHNLGLLIGLFSPRCADLWPATRQEAVSCVYCLLYLQLGYEGEPLAGQRRCRAEGAEPGPLLSGKTSAQRHAASCLCRLLPRLPGRRGRAAPRPQGWPRAP